MNEKEAMLRSSFVLPFTDTRESRHELAEVVLTALILTAEENMSPLVQIDKRIKNSISG